MWRWHAPFTLNAGLALVVALAAPSQIRAQDPPIASGSGRGVSPGVTPGDSPSSTRTTRGDLIGPIRDNPLLGKSPYPGAQLGPSDPAAIDAIDAQLLDQALRVTEPSERALALERVARSKILSAAYSASKLDEAHEILIHAGNAVIAIPPGNLRDLRLRQLIFAHIQLAEEELRQGLVDTPRPLDQPAEKYPARKFDDRTPWFNKSLVDYGRASELCDYFLSSNYQSDMLFRISESESGSNGSQSIVLITNLADGVRKDLVGQETQLYRVADRALVQSLNIAQKIPLYIWRDRALLTVAAAASTSEQFPRAVEAAKLIPQPEFRADALIRVAEAQARKNWTNDATATYNEAARAVASIPMADPRSTIASVLIDSLIAVGRYQDARSSIVFYPDDERRMNALGAVAQSQGERNLASTARGWIDREAPADWRSVLNRRVNDGMIAAIERRRSQSLPFGSPGILPGIP
jgi:hypothetical protein